MKGIEVILPESIVWRGLNKWLATFVIERVCENYVGDNGLRLQTSWLLFPSKYYNRVWNISTYGAPVNLVEIS